MNNTVSQSRFFMWRTLFAVAHVDNVVTDEEIAFMAKALEDTDFTDQQLDILKDDIVNAKDVGEMFKSITDIKDRVLFFDFARDLVWADGDFGSEEQSVILKLMQEHLKDTNVDDLVGEIKLEFEDNFSDTQPVSVNSDHSKGKKKNIIDIIKSFRHHFH